MSREYARRSRGGGNLPLIIAIVGTVIVVAVVLFFLFGNGGTGLFGPRATDTPPPPPITPVPNTPTPGPSFTPTPQPTVVVVLPSESPSAVVVTNSPTPTPQKTFPQAKVFANSLNVREGPGLDYAKIGTVKYGQVFKVWDETTKFVKIQLPSGVYGWIWEDYTVRGDESLPTPPPKPEEPSFMSKAELLTSTTIKVTFTEGVWGNSGKTANVPATSFEVKEGSSTVAITGITDCAGGTHLTLTIGSTSGGDLKVYLKEDGVYNTDGEGTPAGSYDLGEGADNVAPTVSFSGGTSTKTITVTFSENVGSNSDGTGNLDSGDFVLTGQKNIAIDSVTHTGGTKTATVVFTIDAMTQGETAICSLTLKSSSAYDAGGNACAQTPYNFTYTEP